MTGEAAAAETAACTGVRYDIPCGVVEVDGREHRYLLTVPRAGQPSRELAVADLGGPGLATLTSGTLARFLNDWDQPERLLFLEEPWVKAETGVACESALEADLVALRASTGARGEGARVARDCDTSAFGWRPGEYREAALAVAAREDLAITTVVAHSFGAPRTAELATVDTVRRVVLNSPAPAAGAMDGSRYLEHRAAATLRALQQGCDGCTVDEVEQLLGAAAGRLDAEPVALDTRTPPVVGADVLAAALRAPYVEPSDRRDLVAALRAPGADGAERIAALSDATLLRYNGYDVSPARLAYLQEVCAAYAPWPTARPAGLLARALHALHEPCAEAPAAVGPGGSGPAAARAPVCLGHSTGDAVTPPAFADTWTALRDTLVVQDDGLLHSDTRHTTACLRALEKKMLVRP